MKLKEMCKRFFTLNVHDHAGFTLVELIIVIAILAILSGAAVAGYSAYVKKANQQADKTMIAEIENALMLAYYSDISGTTADFVLLLPDGNAVAGGAFAETAMTAAYGSNWKTTLKLKYNGWTINSAMLNSALSSNSVSGSSYLTNGDVADLLGNVQHVTSAAAGLLGSVSQSESHYLYLLENAMGTEYMERAVTAGVIGKNATTGEYYLFEGTYTDNGGTITASTDLQNQLSNLMVFGVADQMEGASSDEMANMMLVGLVDGVEVDATKYSVAAILAARYALYKAYALDCDENEAFDELNEDMVGVSGTTEAKAVLDAFVAEHKEALLLYITDEEGNPNDTFNNNVTAVTQIMNGVTDVSPDYSSADALKNGTLFTSDTVASDLNLFVGMATFGESLTDEQLANLQALLAANPNAVLVLINNGIVISSLD